MSAKNEKRVALVTGAGRGIGRAIAQRLASEGLAVVITGRTEKHLGEAVGEITYQGGKARHLAGDVRDPAHLAAAVAKAKEVFGRLDVVVANAGISGRVPLGEAGATESGRAIVETNLLGTYYTFDAALPHLEDGGRLVAVASVLAKFGILGLVRATALEVAPRKITCNAVVPGWVDTDMASSGLEQIAAGSGKTVAEARHEAEKAVPLGRFLQPEEIATFVSFLAGPGGAGITGQSISVCGGATAFGG
jgi:NAD(P)-dependent dehydrogenase (short-subunit alcohol dehydrogenase family)